MATQNKPNHTVRLEGSYGDVIWRLPNKCCEELYNYPEDKQKLYLKCYSNLIEHTFHYAIGLMSSPPTVQQKYYDAYTKALRELAHEALNEIKDLKGGLNEN